MYKRQLEAQVREAGLQDRVSLPGRAGNVGDWYQSADLYVLTSRFEGLSNTPVSYTHLDVYKRQHHGHVAAAGAGGEEHAVGAAPVDRAFHLSVLVLERLSLIHI